MIKKAIYLLCFSTISLMALDRGESVPLDIQERLNLEKNKTYVIDFFASWCKSCEKELPLISKVYTDNNVNVIGINVDKNRDDGEAFVKKLNIPFRVIYDTNKAFIESFNPLGFPAIYYIRNGKVAHVVFGAVDNIDKQIVKDIEEIR